MKKLHNFFSFLFIASFGITPLSSVSIPNALNQLTQTIEDSIFAPQSPLELSQEEIGVLANALLLLFMDAHYTQRNENEILTEQEKERWSGIQQTQSMCLDYISTQASQSLQSAISLLQHNGKVVTRTYLAKHQEALHQAIRNTWQDLQESGISLENITQVYQSLLDDAFGYKHAPNDHAVALYDAAYSADQQLQQFIKGLLNNSHLVQQHTRKLQQMSLNLFAVWYKVVYEGMQKRHFDDHCFDIIFYQNGCIPSALRTSKIPSISTLLLEATQ